MVEIAPVEIGFPEIAAHQATAAEARPGKTRAGEDGLLEIAVLKTGLVGPAGNKTDPGQGGFLHGCAIEDAVFE